MPKNNNGDRAIGQTVRKYLLPILLGIGVTTGGGVGGWTLAKEGGADRVDVAVNAKQIEHINAMLRTHVETYRRDMDKLHMSLTDIRKRLDYMSGYDPTRDHDY